MFVLTGPPKSHKLTAKLAKEFAEMTPAPHDRPFSERRVEFLEKQVAKGKARSFLWAKALCKEDGKTYRCNGKHSSILFNRMPLEQIKGDIQIVVEDFVCDTLEDVAHLYGTYDSGVSARNYKDINRTFAAAVPELADMNIMTINLIVSGIAADKWGINTYSASYRPIERAELLPENIDFALWVDGIIGTSAAYFLRRMPVVAAMCTTYRKSKKDATEFWKAVFDQSGRDPRSGDRQLSKFLMTTNATGTTIPNRRQRRMADAREFYARCIHGWNAWRKGETTELKYHVKAKVPSAV